MAGSTARALGLSVGLLVFLSVVPVYADPFFVKVYGRTYKVDPRYPPNELKGPKPQEAMEALPADIAQGPGFRPSHEQVLAEVEERVWIVRNQLAGQLEKTADSRQWRNTGNDTKTVDQEITGSLASGAAQTHVPALQHLYDGHRALDLLVRELRRSIDLPVRSPEAGFSRPKLAPEVAASYRAQNFDPIEAYYGFRRVKAAFRSGDIALLARVTQYPLTVTGKVRRTIRNRDQLMAAKKTVMDPRLREAVAKSTFETVFVRDKGMMLGGEVWITPDKAGFALGAITVE
ncbi:hypothetical protein AAII07_43265 [Microvirga sp. 0TCS3.31]